MLTKARAYVREKQIFTPLTGVLFALSAVGLIFVIVTGEGFVRGNKPGIYWLEIYKLEAIDSLLFIDPCIFPIASIFLLFLAFLVLKVRGFEILLSAGLLAMLILYFWTHLGYLIFDGR